MYSFLSGGDLRVLSLNPNADDINNWLISTDWKDKDHEGRIFFFRPMSEPALEVEENASEIYVFENYMIFIYENENDFWNYLVGDKDEK